MYSYRCTHRHCRKRYSFRRPLEAYVRPPGLTPTWKCGACKRGELHTTNKHISAWNERQRTCHCGLIPYPHRLGSVDRNHGYCVSHPSFDPWKPEVKTMPDTLREAAEKLRQMRRWLQQAPFGGVPDYEADKLEELASALETEADGREEVPF